MSAAPAAAWRWPAGLAYGVLGAPLAFVALPLYVQLPQHYAQRHGVELATLGLLLLAVRGLDALVDPLLGRWADRALARGPRAAWSLLGAAAFVVGLGFVQLFFAPDLSGAALLAWCAGWLALTCAAWSLASVLHQAWGARLGGGEAAQSRWVAAREGAGLVGVVLASVLPSLAGLQVTAAVLVGSLLLGWGLLRLAPQAAGAAAGSRPGDLAHERATLWAPWQRAGFRRLLAVFAASGIAVAIPATLVLFYIRDRLQAPAWEGAFLALYFVAGAGSLPLWVRAVRRWGAVRAWGLGMATAVAGFAAAATLGAGDALLFAGVCLASGLSLGAQLALPPALLAQLAADSGRQAVEEGLLFGWWNAVAKLNLALAAGLALPLLGALGYVPGGRDPQGLAWLGWVYAGLPCVLMLLALLLLRRLLWPRPPQAAAPRPQGAPS